MNHDERQTRLAQMTIRLLHVLSLARKILADHTPATLPEVVTNDTLPKVWDAISRTVVLLDEEPMISLLPDQAAFLLQQGLAKSIMVNRHIMTMVELHLEGEGDKLKAPDIRAAELLLDDADVTLHVANEELGGEPMDD